MILIRTGVGGGEVGIHIPQYTPLEKKEEKIDVLPFSTKLTYSDPELGWKRDPEPQHWLDL